MATEDFKRKLTAVFSADVAGYSRLMGENEAATVKTLANYREIMASLIKQHRGRVVDSPGDNVLAEFVSVVDAVQCAVAIQKELKARNAELPENRKMEFRIGINLGDVIDEEDRIYGDGVNIAARLEALADPGGICISKTAFDQIETKLPLGYEFLGEQEVKNIAKPVGAYRVLMDAEAAGKVIGELRPKTKQLRGVAIGAVAVLIIVAASLVIWNFYFRPAFEPASVEKMAFPLPDKPSIAVLPFVNMSEDKGQEYFSDGLTEEIISALSRVPKLFVIARNSTFTYKEKPVKVQQVSEELGVRYVLEGSVRKAENRVRITAQLIDAITGHHLWSERYDRDLRDIFALQDEITIKIITALQVELTEGESARLVAKGTDNLEAYIKYLQGNELSQRRTKEDNAAARRIAKEAIVLDPTFAPPYTLLAWTHMMDIWLKSTKSPKQSLTEAIKLAQKSIALDDYFSRAHGLLGWLYTMARQHDKGIAECERAVALNPNGTDAYTSLGIALRYAGRHEEAVRACEKSVRLNPFPRAGQLTSLGMAYFFTGRHNKAIEACKKAVHIGPNDPLNRLGLASAYVGAGREEEARAEIEVLLTIDPKHTLRYVAKIIPYKNPSDKERVIESMRKAGLPETPPLPLPDKPSIAVLPFVNMSGDPEQEYFSDGISEEIITALSKAPKMFVIARTSSFRYKGKDVDVRTVGRELGVRYVLEGSVRKSEDHLRITAQLVDAKTGNHVWAERYDRELKDIFAVQDEITIKILDAMRLKITSGEHARSMSEGTKNLNAYLKVMEGDYYRTRMNLEDRIRAKKLFEQAIALDPEYPTPYAGLGWCHVMDVMQGTTKSPKESMMQASKLAQKALDMDDNLPRGHFLLGYIHFAAGQWEKAIPALERSLELNPNDSGNLFLFARSLTALGKPQEAIPLFHKALRVDPLNSYFPYWGLGATNLEMERYEEAINYLRKSLESNPKNTPVLAQLAFCYVVLEREEEARGVADEILKLNPKFSVNKLVERYPSRDQVLKQRMQGALLKAGLPE